MLLRSALLLVLLGVAAVVNAASKQKVRLQQPQAEPPIPVVTTSEPIPPSTTEEDYYVLAAVTTEEPLATPSEEPTTTTVEAATTAEESMIESTTGEPATTEVQIPADEGQQQLVDEEESSSQEIDDSKAKPAALYQQYRQAPKVEYRPPPPREEPKKIQYPKMPPQEPPKKMPEYNYPKEYPKVPQYQQEEPKAPGLIDFCLLRLDGDYERSEGACAGEYVTCAAGEMYVRHCANEALAFDAVSGACLEREWVPACGGLATTVAPLDESARTPQPEIGVSCASLADGIYPATVEYGCSRHFASCLAGHLTVLSCYGSLVFDVDSLSCLDRAWVRACGGTPTTTPLPLPADFPLAEFDCAGKSSGNYADGCSNRYVSCSGGVATWRYCPTALHYDPTSDACMPQQYITLCGGYPTTTTTALPAPADSVDFDCSSKADGNYPISGGGHQQFQQSNSYGGSKKARDFGGSGCSSTFVSCFGGVAKGRECGPGLFYDSATDRCLEREWVEACGGRATPAPPADEGVIKEERPDLGVTCSGIGLYADARPGYACSRWYAACTVGGGERGVTMRCAANTRFDPDTQMCRHAAYIAVCGGNPNAQKTQKQQMPTYGAPKKMPQLPLEEPVYSKQPVPEPMPYSRPQIPQEPELPKYQPQVPQEPELPKYRPQVPQEPELPKYRPQVPQEPELPKIPQYVRPQIPQEPEIPTTTTTPAPPKTPSYIVPQVLKEEPKLAATYGGGSKLPQLPQEPERPKIPQEPARPEPKTPQIPESPKDEEFVPDLGITCSGTGLFPDNRPGMACSPYFAACIAGVTAPIFTVQCKGATRFDARTETCRAPEAIPACIGGGGEQKMREAPKNLAPAKWEQRPAEEPMPQTTLAPKLPPPSPPPMRPHPQQQEEEPKRPPTYRARPAPRPPAAQEPIELPKPEPEPKYLPRLPHFRQEQQQQQVPKVPSWW